MWREISADLRHHYIILIFVFIAVGYSSYPKMFIENELVTAFCFGSYILNFIYFSAVIFQRVADKASRFHVQLPYSLTRHSYARLISLIIPQVLFLISAVMVITLFSEIDIVGFLHAIFLASIIIVLSLFATITTNDLAASRNFPGIMLFWIVLLCSGLLPLWDYLSTIFLILASSKTFADLPDISAFYSSWQAMGYYLILAIALLELNRFLYTRQRSYLK